MKKTFAAVILLAALGVFLKLAFKHDHDHEVGSHLSARLAESVELAPADPEVGLLDRYPQSAELVKRVVETYRHNAIAIEKTDGLRGLTLLDKLGVEAIFLYEKHPGDFHRLRDALNDDAAADILLHWREYFELKHSNDVDRKILISEITRLTPTQRRIVSKYPNVLPILLADPNEVVDFVNNWSGDSTDLTDALAILGFVSLENGAADLRQALRILEHHGPLAVEAFRSRGLDGFALAGLYGPVLSSLGRAMPLDEALIILHVNSDYVDELLQTHRPEAVATRLRRVASTNLAKAVGGNPNALRLVVEFGEKGEQALRKAGPDAPDVVYGDFSDAVLRNQAVAALAEHGAMALAMLDKYAVDADFREILRALGPGVIPPIAQTDASPEILAKLQGLPSWSWKERLANAALSLSGENGQATIKLIKSDGLERVAELHSSSVEYYQFLPLYDLIHLGGVISRGQSPTSGEMAWAVIDGCFVVADALSLVAFQPEGAAAAEAARVELKAATREAAKTLGRETVEEVSTNLGKAAAGRGLTARGAEGLSARASKWWAVRASGGTHELLRRLPEALPRLSLDEIAGVARGLCSKARLKLSAWGAMRFFKDGVEVLRAVPPSKGLKYLGLQLAQASVGLVGFHKMEEHLKSRRP